VTRYLLDTNIISNAIKPIPSDVLLAWMSTRGDEDLFIASMTIAEIRRGILELPSGRKRERLEMWVSGPDGPQAVFAGRILSFDAEAAVAWARLMAEGRSAGRPRSVLDMIVAAIAQVNGCIIATDNERDFVGLDVVNPLRPAGPS